MKRDKIFLPRLTLSTSLVMLLIFSTGCQDSPPKKAQVPTYPSLKESFDQDFYHDLEMALKKGFRGEYKRAVENKKAAFVVVDLANLKQPRIAGVNPDVMMVRFHPVSNKKKRITFFISTRYWPNSAMILPF
jgi:hypothetical protein